MITKSRRSKAKPSVFLTSLTARERFFLAVLLKSFRKVLFEDMQTEDIELLERKKVMAMRQIIPISYSQSKSKEIELINQVFALGEITEICKYLQLLRADPICSVDD